jgi:hypothetical protein
VHATNDLVELKKLDVKAGAGTVSLVARAERQGPGEFHLTSSGQSERFPLVNDDQLLAALTIAYSLEGDATADQLDRAAELADQFSAGEARVTHDQNLLLPWVRCDQLPALWRAARQHGFARANIRLLTDMIACPGGDFCALANARSIPIAEAITERYQDMDEFEFVERLGRLTNSNPSEVTASARQLTKVQFKCQKIFDRKDDEFLGTLGRPDSEVMQGMRFAWNRTVDTKVALAAVDPVYGGVEPYVTPTPLPSTQKVVVNSTRTTPAGAGANTNLTPWKIIRAVSILKANEINVNEEECFIAMDASMEAALIYAAELSPNDVWATVYRHLGIDKELAVPDLGGRPMPILPSGEPISELLG